ncbi:TetR/AcrR family transcriptional regulator [Chitinophaga ginsengisoli]|uniref:TetR family transcriptional regulator n=1 Tax=Chitinophaga ginsengisoli TaxID=363837 RepID=A0A2P8GLL5_9BACT|nr:TetR/AcrR family transcriptional regulator [Chitinophaga ginsengisoli]PSL34862.1 TetR family transcriptional regulator [Chitinophaga ginsengisoli]
MGVKERRLRLKEESRTNILDAALSIAKARGWQAVSMRKIADMIKHTPPVIYDYFLNKEAILMDLARMGFAQLSGNIHRAQLEHDLPEKQLESMWTAYWDYAFAEKELYQLMFGINTQGCCDNSNMPEVEALAALFGNVIRQVLPTEQQSDEHVSVIYYFMWSAVHGLISINVVYKHNRDDFNQQVLLNAVRNVTAFLLINPYE